MKQQQLSIAHIPAILWGDSSPHLVIAVHGYWGNKKTQLIRSFAAWATDKGFQVLSFDLPEHGERKEDSSIELPICIEEFQTILNYAGRYWNHISLFANSLGAYLSLLAFEKEIFKQAWFVAPVVDMSRLMSNLFAKYQIDEEMLKKEHTILAPSGEKLNWDFYLYVLSHPVELWQSPTHILYGESDETCDMDTILDFAKKFHADVEIIPSGEHFFHTEEHLQTMTTWLDKSFTKLNFTSKKES